MLIRLGAVCFLLGIISVGASSQQARGKPDPECSLIVSPNKLSFGEMTTLSWSSKKGAQTMSLVAVDDEGNSTYIGSLDPVTNGNRSFTGEETTTYVGTVVNNQ